MSLRIAVSGDARDSGMITIDGLRGIPVFAPLPAETLEYLARAVEDIRLLPGEYFAHEGDERALFAVIEGSAEITKVVNGEERVIGVRKSGRFFGEVPMTLSTPFPASGRAAEASRVIKLDVTVYYTLAALAPSVPARVAGLALRYLDSLQAIAAEQPEIEVRLVGPRLDARVHRVAGFLTRNQVAFDRVTLDAPVNGQEYPIVELAGGARLAAPTMREVATAVGLDVEPSASEYDVVILGGGPAGLTAAVNGAAEGLRTVVIESLAPGGQAGTSTRIENYTGFPFGISGDDLASRALKQAKRLGAEIVVTRTVEALRPDRREIILDGGETLRAPASSSPRVSNGAPCPCRRSSTSSATACTTERLEAMPAWHTARTSASSVPATRRARPRCSSPGMRSRSRCSSEAHRSMRACRGTSSTRSPPTTSSTWRRAARSSACTARRAWRPST